VLSAKEALPCAVAEHHDAGGALLIVIRLKCAAEDGLGAEGSEPGPGDLCGQQMERAAILLCVEALLLIHGG
jgi:hypothetical protein